jgi:ribosome-interacting GTPase 1
MVAEYPFTTQSLIPGMMTFENVQIQLVDTPPLEHKNIRVLLGNTLRRADLIIIVVSLESNAVEQLKSALEILKEIRIEFPVGGEAITLGSFTKKSLVLANKSDHTGTSKNLSELSVFCKDKFTMISASAATGNNIDNLKKTIFDELEIIRIYTKVPGTKADLNDPMVINKGDTVDIAAEAVHKDFRSKLKYAIVWGSGVYDGQRVSRKHVLKDGDIIEFHI